MHISRRRGPSGTRSGCTSCNSENAGQAAASALAGAQGHPVPSNPGPPRSLPDSGNPARGIPKICTVVGGRSRSSSTGASLNKRQILRARSRADIVHERARHVEDLHAAASGSRRRGRPGGRTARSRKPYRDGMWRFAVRVARDAVGEFWW